MKIAGKSYKALVFDFDGVLADSVEVKTHAFGALFEAYGQDVQDQVIAHHRAHGGMTRREKFVHYFDRFLEKPLDTPDLDRLCEQFSSLVVEKVIAAGEIQGATAFLDHCKRESLPCFVDSATPDDELELIINRRGLNKYFKKVLGSEKSKTENLKWVLDTYDFSSRECLFFGDASSDYGAAVNCDVDFMGILPDQDAPLLKTYPDIVWAEDFLQLEKGMINGR